MLGRLLLLLVLIAVGAMLGIGSLGHWLTSTAQAAFIGGVGGALVYAIAETRSATRLLRWLTQVDGQAPEPRFMLWPYRELQVRMAKLLRAKDRAGEDARNRLQDFLHAIQHSPIGVLLLDGENRLRWCNALAAQHLGLEPARDSAQIITNLVRNPSFAAYLLTQSSNKEVIFDGASNNTGQVQKLAVQVHDYVSEISGKQRLLLTRDISDILQAENMRRDFVANVSHEMATPLTVLSGFVETLQNVPFDAQETPRMLSLMRTQAARMETLLKDLLTLSKLEASPVPSTTQAHDLTTLLTEIAADAQALQTSLHTQHNIIWPESAAVGWRIIGTRSELYSAMSNLVQNAIRYTPSGGTIHVEWEVGEPGDGGQRGASFSVRDTGVGIAPEHVPRLTERFYRVDSSRSRETGGTGLGLAIVKHIALRHGAQLHIQSQPGIGSTFSLSFPPTRIVQLVQ